MVAGKKSSPWEGRGMWFTFAGDLLRWLDMSGMIFEVLIQLPGSCPSPYPHGFCPCTIPVISVGLDLKSAPA